MELDATDGSILLCLEHEARISNKDLAARVGLSESACRERVRKLERAKVILGYKALVSPAIVRNRVEAWADISLHDLPQAVCHQFLEIVARTPTIALAFQMSGAYDFLIYFVAPDISQWRVFCSELRPLGIASSRIRFGVVVESHKPTSEAMR